MATAIWDGYDYRSPKLVARSAGGGRDRCLRLGSKRQARGGPHL
jgi:hypothetical protein